MDVETILKWISIIISVLLFIALVVYLAFAIYYFNKARTSTLTVNEARNMLWAGIVAIIFLFAFLINTMILTFYIWKSHSDTKDMHEAHMATHKNATLVPNNKLASLKPNTYTETCYPNQPVVQQAAVKPKVVVKGTTVPEDQVYCLVPMSEKCASLFGGTSQVQPTETVAQVPHTHTHPTKISFSDWE